MARIYRQRTQTQSFASFEIDRSTNCLWKGVVPFALLGALMALVKNFDARKTLLLLAKEVAKT